VIYGGIYFTMRKYLRRIGQIRLKANRERYHTVQESMGGVKELKIIGLEDVYLSRFRKAAYRMARVQISAELLGNTPAMGSRRSRSAA
jgi:ATP-binding cassette, subfamily B, bacterial PglK